MKNLILFIASIVVLSNTCFSQSIALNRAIKFYETNNIGFAEKEILKAVKSPVSSEEELAKTMNYFFLIMKKVYGSEDILIDNLSKVSNMAKAYVKCKENDKSNTYVSNLKVEMKLLGETLLVLSEKEFDHKEYFKYLLIMDYYVMLMDHIGVNSGLQYAKMAEACLEVNQYNRASSYWTKMIDSGYKIENAYEMLIPFFYARNEHNIVDSLITKSNLELKGSNLVIGTIEIKRLIEKDLLFKASKKAEALLQSSPKNIDILYLFGSTKLKLRYDDEGLNALLEVAYLDENHFDSRLELAKYYLEAEDEKVNLVLAKNYIEQSKKLKPLDVELIKLAQEYARISNVNLASGDSIVSSK